MTNDDARLLYETLEPLRDHLDTMHAVVHEKHLPAPVDLAQARLADQALVELAYSRAHRQRLLGWTLTDAPVPHIPHRAVKPARDGAGGHGENVNLVAQLLQALPTPSD